MYVYFVICHDGFQLISSLYKVILLNWISARYILNDEFGLQKLQTPIADVFPIVD